MRVTVAGQELLLGSAGLRRGWLLLSASFFVMAAMFLAIDAVYAGYARDLPSIDSFGTGSLSQVTRVYASDGKTLLEVRYRQNRTVVPLDLVSLELQQATVATEDREFYSENGVNPLRIAAAALFDVTHRQAAQGASTITQQVVKNSLLAPNLAQEKTFDRKVKEFILATELEARYSKHRILEMYLNAIYYGHGAYGAEAAARTYFGLHARELKLSEASFLAGLPQSPGRYDPATAGGYTAGRARQRAVLQSMVTGGYITQAQADRAFSRDLKNEIGASFSGASTPARQSAAPHFVDYVLSLIAHKYGAAIADRGGLKVITTLDLHAQQLAQQATQKEVASVARSTRPGVDAEDGQAAYAPNDGAMLVMAPQTGAILAMVGSRDYFDKSVNGDVNMVVDDPHQVGSSFKPYTYVTALANGYGAGSTLLDGDPNFPGYPGYHPHDFDNRELGSISLAESLQQSRNLSSMHLFETLGPGRVFATAEALGISPTYLQNGGPSATLGTNEMRMLDHVAAYGAFANGGRRLHPWAIAKITDSAGHVLEDNTAASGKMEQAIPVKAAMALTDILKGAVKPDGYGLHIPLALKSGTSEHWTDSWYVGYTTDLVVGAWMGHTDAHGGHYHMHVIYGENGAGLMLSHFLRDWYHGTSPPDFGATEARGCAPTPPSSPRPSASPRPTATTGGPPRAPYQVPSVVPAASPTPCPSPSATAPGRARSSSGPAFAPGAGTGSQGGVPPGASPPPPQPQPSPRRTCIVQPICR